MPKENIMDTVVDRAKERMSWLEEKLKKDFGKVKKFRQEPVSRADMVRLYEQMTPDDLERIIANQVQFYQQKQQELAETIGRPEELIPAEELAREDANEWIYEMEVARQDKRIKRDNYDHA